MFPFARITYASTSVGLKFFCFNPFLFLAGTLDMELVVEPGADDDPPREYLLLRSLPYLLNDRYGRLPKKIYVRDCYRQIYETASQLMVDGKMELGTSLCTGVPGIGKSLFLLYVMYRYLHDTRFPEKQLAVQLKQGEITRLKPTEDPTKYSFKDLDVKDAKKENFLLLCDLREKAEPDCRGKRGTFIFSSPNKDRYKETMKCKHSFTFLMPTWSEDELRCVDANAARWYEAYALFGGVPRHVLTDEFTAEENVATVDRAILENGRALVTKFFECGRGPTDSDSEQSYLLLHINPPCDENGDYKFRGKFPEYSFASDIVFQRLMAKYS